MLEYCKRYQMKAHPIYKNYGADKKGNIYNIKLNKQKRTTERMKGQLYVCLSRDGKIQSMMASKFIYECYNGIIKDNMVVYHKDNDEKNNAVENLDVITQSDKMMKKFIETSKSDKKRIEAINQDTNEKIVYKSIYGAGKILNIIPASIKRVCEGTQRTAISKNDGVRYSFKII